MKLVLLFCLCLGSLTSHISAKRHSHKWGSVTNGEYCDYENFEAECSNGEIIVMEKAEYGHMRIGKCVELDLGHLGCHSDVINILDSKCTGKQHCEIAVIDAALRNAQSCPKGVVLYLEASYWCVQAPANLCLPIKATAQEAYIPSTQIYDMSCPGGTSVNLVSVPGQHLVLSLFKPAHVVSRSAVYGLAVGDVPDDEIQVEYNGQTERVLGPTKSSNVGLILDRAYRRDPFIIGFRAEGCPDLSPPPTTKFYRDGDVATVSCIDTPQSWQLTCRGIHWLGVIGNCSRKAPLVMESKTVIFEEKVQLTLPKDVILLLIGCATVFIAIIVITVGYVTLKKAKLEQTSKDKTLPTQYATVQRRSILKPRPNSDYLTPTYPAEGQEAQVYDFPLPDIPATETLQTRGTVKRNNEEDYTASLSSTSTDYTRKYFVLDKDYIAVNNMHNC